MILFDLRLTVTRASSGKFKRRFEDTVQICIEDIAQLCVGAQTFLHTLQTLKNLSREVWKRNFRVAEF